MLIVKEFQDTVKEGKFQKKQIISALMKNMECHKAASNILSTPRSVTRRNFVPVAEQVSVNINGLVAMGYVIAA